MIGYKIFTAFHLISINTEPFLQINYVVGEAVSADPELLKLGYGLVYFKTKKEAESFIAASNSIEVLMIQAVRVISPMPLVKKRIYARQQDVTNLEEFKAALESTELEATIENWPPGTAMCETVVIQRES